MPSLPFTFEDLKNLNPADSKKVSSEGASAVDPTTANDMAAQNFLVKKISDLKDNLSSSDGLIDIGLSLNPITRATDMASKFFGGPGLHKGFVDGTTMTGTVRTPPLMF